MERLRTGVTSDRYSASLAATALLLGMVWKNWAITSKRRSERIKNPHAVRAWTFCKEPKSVDKSLTKLPNHSNCQTGRRCQRGVLSGMASKNNSIGVFSRRQRGFLFMGEVAQWQSARRNLNESLGVPWRSRVRVLPSPLPSFSLLTQYACA